MLTCSGAGINRPDSRLQVMTLEENVKAYGLNFFGSVAGSTPLVAVRS